MKIIFNFIIELEIILFITSCTEKKYSYVEVVKEKDLFEKSFIEKELEPEDIFAINDSTAYIEAYRKYCISERVYNQMKAKGMDLNSIPFAFHLYDEKQKEVLPIVSKEILKEIHNDIFALRIDASTTHKEDMPIIIDSTTVNKLSKLFVFSKDEFDPKGMTWIKPKSAPKYANRNALYCYFMRDDSGVSNFRFRIQYYADDWLFFYKCQFSIDGKAYEFIPQKTETDNGDGYIWEWFDEPIMTSEEVSLVKALASAKNAKIKFIGRQYYDIKQIPKSELESIKNTIDLYIAMGGKFE